MKHEYKLGDRVTASWAISRVDAYLTRPVGPSLRYNKWERQLFRPRVTGILIGFRSYRDGYITHGSDDGVPFRVIGYVPVALIAVNLNQNPVPVMREDLMVDD